MSVELLIVPGHGGTDKGGGTNSQFLEKDMNLKISLYQYLRCRELQINSDILRHTDITINKYERIKKVLSADAAYCFANHINWNQNPAEEGCQIIHSIYQNGKFANSVMSGIEKFGQKKHSQYVRTLPEDSTKDYYYMHRETGNTRTLIIEYGFASNTADSNRLIKNWPQFAEGAIYGYCNFTGHQYKSPLFSFNDYNEMINKKSYIVTVQFSSKINAEIFYESTKESGLNSFMGEVQMLFKK